MTKIVKWPSDSLRATAEEFDFTQHDAAAIAKQLAEAMLEHDGVGIAANQIGLPHRALAILAEQVIVMFNPKIVDYSPETDYLVEGCLSSPNLFINIKRPKAIRVRYTQPNGETVTKQFSGLTARIIQHEFDHLNGIDFSQRANRYHLEKGKKTQKKIQLTPRQMVQNFVRV